MINQKTGLADITPIELYDIEKGKVSVKREDLCCPYPGPPFSKIRGVVKRMQKMKEEGITAIGYAETSISMACWGLSWSAKQVGGIQVYAFMPKYKGGQPSLLEYHRKMWESFGAITVPIESPNRGKINHYKGRKWLEKNDPSGVMIEMGIPFPETTEETAKQVRLTALDDCKSLVVNVGSGVICAGILNGLSLKGLDIPVYGVTCRKYETMPSIEKRISLIFKRSGVFYAGLFGYSNFHFVNSNIDYTTPETFPAPFPCNPYYDRKAWKWLCENYDRLEKPVLFWNIGGGGEYA